MRAPHLLLSLALALALLSGCAMTPEPTPAVHHAPIRYLALGDSYTIGEAVTEDERWPHQLADLLQAEGLGLQAPTTIARTGWTTDELDAAIDEADPGGDFGFVTLLIGVNNQYRGREVENYREEFSGLLERAIGFAGGDAGRVMVLSIPDWGVTPFGQASGRDPTVIAAQIDTFNAVNRDLTLSRGAAWVDITPLSRRLGAGAAMVADDGLHPSGAMYREWARAALPTARALLTR